ncbi:hypothetical protein ACO0LO_21385 [Undibacterium sp. TJN25]|uniref:hypothetical protein n=1 Tax=Undibacterium sp. TJN25 TaxID=3413056 RepID=UPI003BF27AEA
MSEVFTPHGRFSLHIDDRVIVSEVTGPWNLELVKDWAREVNPYAEQMQNGGPWGGIAIIHESMLCTPEAMTAIGAASSYAVAHYGCIAQLVVAARDVAGRGVVESAFHRLYEDVCACEFFDDYAAAKVWLDQLILEKASA